MANHIAPSKYIPQLKRPSSNLIRIPVTLLTSVAEECSSHEGRGDELNQCLVYTHNQAFIYFHKPALRRPAHMTMTPFLAHMTQ